MRVLRPPTEEEADDQEAGGQHERPKARAAPSDKGRVGFVQGIPHLGAAGGASWDLGLCCGPPAAGQRDSGTAASSHLRRAYQLLRARRRRAWRGTRFSALE